MKRQNVILIAVGLVLGFAAGFAFANTANQRGYAREAADAGQHRHAEGLPADHPPIPGADAGPSAATVEAATKLAAERPDDFDAQVRAAELVYSAHRYDEAAKLFARAEQLRPAQFEVLVGLGNTHFDAGRFEEAARWYAAALSQQPDNVNVRTDLGLTFYFREPRDVERAVKEFRASLERDPDHMQTLQNLTVALTSKGDAAGARAALARLEAVNPQNPALPRLRAELDRPGAR